MGSRACRGLSLRGTRGLQGLPSPTPFPGVPQSVRIVEVSGPTVPFSGTLRCATRLWAPILGVTAPTLVRQVGPRDGLQNEKTTVSTDLKVELINRQAA
jgi:hypothetical protein